MNRILVAQKITQPQAIVSALTTLLHFLMNYLFIVILHLGPVSVAWATSLSNLSQLLLMLAYVLIFKKGGCMLGEGFSIQALKVRAEQGCFLYRNPQSLSFDPWQYFFQGSWACKDMLIDTKPPAWRLMMHERRHDALLLILHVAFMHRNKAAITLSWQKSSILSCGSSF